MLDEPMTTKQLLVATLIMILFAVVFYWFLFTFVESRPLATGTHITVDIGIHCHIEDGTIVFQSCNEWMVR